MAKRKQKKGQLSLRLGLDDERVPKLFGILLLFLAVYLGIAFISYLFTWKIDFDLVDEHSFELLFSNEHRMANWLGRLGAIVSNFFFYWTFGLPSLLLVYLFATLGLNRIYRRPLKQFMVTFNYTMVVIFFASVFLEFVAGSAEFRWGGALGELVWRSCLSWSGPCC
jgi:S-DNA-T family DNA segregation ATPase FtsK/SpoIIIE